MDMSRLRNLAHFVQRRLERDRNLPKTVLLHKAFRYAEGLGAARFYLRHVDHIGRGVRTTGRPRIENRGVMHIGDGAHLRSLSAQVELATGPRGRLDIGAHASINGASIAALDSVRIGARTRIGAFSLILDSSFHEVVARGRRPRPRPVVIEDDVWLTSRCVVLPGVTVGRASVVGAWSVLTRDVPPFSIYAGNPAKKIGEINPEEFIPEGEEQVEAESWSY